MDAGAEFRILGAFEVLERGRRLALGGARQRALLLVLLLHRGEVVSTDRLIDELWGERPPVTATKAVQVYVSHLRKALGPGVLETHGRGYQLAVSPDRVDVDCFEALVVDGRAALAAGEPRRAVDLFRTALGLWRGPALADFAYEPFARREIDRLEEARLGALEDRIDAELALGQHRSVIGELERLVGENPLRERPCELLMLALYRAGRQAEALAAYRSARALLDRELGLEPGPRLRELQEMILRHDARLEAPPPAEAAAERSAAGPLDARRRRRRAIGLVSLIAGVLAVAFLALAGGRGRSVAMAGQLRTAALGVFTASGQPRAAVALAAVPSRITSGLGAVWTTSYDEGTLLRIDPGESAVVQTVRVGTGATGVVVDAGDVWIADALDNQLIRVDGATDQVVQRIAVGAGPDDLAAGAGALWVAGTGGGTVTRVDPVTGAVLGVSRVGPAPSGIAVGDGAVWVALGGTSGVARLDLRTGRLVQIIRVGSGPSAVAVGRGGVWVANQLDATVSLINPATDRVVLTRAVMGAPTALAAVGAAVWVAGDASGMTRVEDSGAVHTFATPSPVTALAPSPEGVLVGVSGIGAQHRGGTLVGLIADPAFEAMDPSSCCDIPPNVLGLSYDGLLTYSKSPSTPGRLVPDLAISIPAPQDGGRSYTFRLRAGLRYWTGAPVRASDFLRGFERAAQGSDNYAAYLNVLPGAAACPRARHCDLSAAILTNDRAGTVTLRLSHPDPNLLTALGQPNFAPDPGGRGVRPGTGPYRVARQMPGHLVEFTRNPYFREWSPAAQPAGYPDRIVLHVDGTPSADIAAVLNGQADWTFDQPTASQRAEIQLRAPSLLHTESAGGTDWIDLNTHAPPFDDLRVRQALNFAIDRNAIVKLYGGPAEAIPTCQIIPPTIPGYAPYCPYTRHPAPSGRWSGPDLARAQRLIAASGTRGDPVTLVTQNFGPSNEPVARYVIALLSRLGYRAHLRILTPEQMGALLDEDYRHPPQMHTASWTASVPSASDWITLQLSCGAWHPPTRLTDHALFCDPAVDRIAARAAELNTTDPVAADRLWTQADRDITNLAPWVTTVNETETDLVSQRVGDYQYVPTVFALLDQLWVR